MKIGFISLGCSKNLVVTEEMIGLFKKHGYEIVEDAGDADIILINTCGFIESAKDEGIKTILEMSDYKEGNCKYLIVTGCLVERYKEELIEELPEVDLFIKISEYGNFWNMINRLVYGNDINDMMNYKYREITTGKTTAYLKIAEGCSNYCTYCAIPYIQGKYVSRPYEEIIDEAKLLVSKGIKELVVIAQDTTKYGLDLYGKARLPELLKSLDEIDGLVWIRFLYSYPESISDELIEVVKNSKKICHYFDLPIQHISNDVLKRMNRKSTKDNIVELVNKLRREIPDVILRTTLITGFPGETEENFNELCQFVKDSKFDRLGAFAYSMEDGTPAARFVNQIAKKEKERRRKKIMFIQQGISKEVLKSRIGKEYRVVIDDISLNGEYFVCRSYMDVPSEDGVILVPNNNVNMIGEFINVRLVSSSEYDYIGEIV